MTMLPERYLKIITPLVTTARGILEKGEPLSPFAFVGNFETGLTIPVTIQTNSVEQKDHVAASIRMVAEEIQADFIFLLMEAYSLRADKVPRFEAILDEYGSLANCPESWRIDVVNFSLETRHGVWTAQTPIKQKGLSKKKRTIGEPEFKLFTEVQGRFVDLLPGKPGLTEGAGILH